MKKRGLFLFVLGLLLVQILIPLSFAGGSCFPAGTKILMVDNSYKNIEDVKVGEFVLSYDISKKLNVPEKVLALESPIREHICKLYISDNKNIELTDEHPVYTSQGWKSINPTNTLKENSDLNVNTLKEGDRILFSDGIYRVLNNMDCKSEVIKTYNLKDIENLNDYYANDILVHNKGGGGAPAPAPTHLACSNGDCVSVSGGGANTCSNSGECKHTECVNWKCALVNTPGASSCTADTNCDPCLTALGFCFNSGICTRDSLTVKHCKAYTSQFPVAGHGADIIWINVGGSEMTLQDAIVLGKLNGVITGGAIGFDKPLGHTGNDVLVKVAGVEKSLQQAINEGSLCCSGCASVSLDYTQKLIFGHYASSLIISNPAGVEKSLQQAINDGEFC